MGEVGAMKIGTGFRQNNETESCQPFFAVGGRRMGCCVGLTQTVNGGR